MGMHAALVKHVTLPLWSRRHGRNHLRHVAWFEQVHRSSAEEIAQMQRQALQSLAMHAYANCRYYREVFDQARVRPQDVQDAAALAALPVLTKDILRSRPAQDLLARNYPPAARHRAATGGSTGSPLVFYRDDRCIDMRWAAAIAFDRWCGWDIGEKVGVIWGAQQDYQWHRTLKARARNLVMDRILPLDSSAMTPARVREYIARLRRFRPRMILGYPNPLYLVAREMLDMGIGDLRPRGVVATAEPLAPEQRAVIEKAFSCRVFDRYTSRESGIIATQCAAGEGMHISAGSVILELVRGDRPAAAGEAGVVLVTDLLNYAMPLLRYQIGDVAEMLSEPCACGRALPRLRNVGGRTTDFLVASDGSLVSGIAMWAMLREAEFPGQAQFVQERHGEVVARISGREHVRPADMERLEKGVRRYLGERIRLEIQYVDRIAATPSGKYLYTICRLPLDEVWKAPAG
jgi:phenylacetate-CoA ligase